jgi:hypothetical protein
MNKALSALPLVASVAVALSIGCIDIHVNTNSGGQGLSGVPSSIISGPAPDYGSINPYVTEIGSNPGYDACFTTAQGWDGFISLPKFFEGPGGSHGFTVYPNTNGRWTLVVKTCDPLNVGGTPLQTGIVIVDLTSGASWCQQANCTIGGQGTLTVNTITLSNTHRYKANIYFKTSTKGSLSNVMIDWSYQ